MKHLALAALSAIGLAQAARAANAADAAHPTVVELFQSQGCSSCPPANANLLAIADRPDVLALAWEVTYWDYLGWKDTFASTAFTQRQYDYAASLGHNGVFTPQIVVNGRVDGVGSQAGELAGLIARGNRGTGGPTITFSHNQARIGAGTGQADIVMVRYDPALIQVPIHAGENAGQTLPHRNVVREFARLGVWRGLAQIVDLPVPSRVALKTAILVQDGPAGPVVAAAHD